MFWAVAMKRFWLILAAMLGLAASAVPASAAVVYTLNCTNAACSSTSTTFGTVTLNQTGAVGSEHVTISVSLASTYYFNTSYALLWNFNSGDAATPAETIVKQGGNQGNFTVQNSGGANGEFAFSPFTTHASSCSGANSPSCFDYAVKHNSNPSIFGADQTLSLDVTKSGGLTLGNFTANTLGFAFAASVTRCTSLVFNIPSCVNSQTFTVAAKAIPEPATWALFFAALAGLTLLYRRRKLARA